MSVTIIRIIRRDNFIILIAILHMHNNYYNIHSGYLSQLCTVMEVEVYYNSTTVMLKQMEKPYSVHTYMTVK